MIPALAKEKSSAGAKAFVRHYIVVLNYSWRHLSTTELDALGARGCADCAAIVEKINQVRAGGGFKHGAAWQPGVTTVIATSGLDELIVQTLVGIDKGRYLERRDGDAQLIKAANVYMDFALVWKSGSWFVDNVEVQ